MILLLLLAAVAAGQPLHAQDWPQRPVRIIVPYAPGGVADNSARFVAHCLEDAFNRPFVVEHRPGATGAVAAEEVARSPADGYTLLLAGLPQIAIMPAVLNTSFDPIKDVVPVTAVATNPLALAVHPSLPVKSVAELVAYARGQNDRLAYAATGVGSITHLAMALFLKRAGIEMTPVMYKGGAPAVTDVVAGHVKVYFANMSAVVPFAPSGALRVLAVSSERRLPGLADVPTMIEAGYPGFKMLNWTGLVAPAGTPREIVDLIAREVSRAVANPKAAAVLAATGASPLGNSPEEFKEMIAGDIPLWAEAVKTAGIHKR
jgi:tripartite-type tricarboxylate transporter receptor subunit TctC